MLLHYRQFGLKCSANRLFSGVLRKITTSSKPTISVHSIEHWFLADRTNGRAIATVLRRSVVCRLSVCDVMYCG